jgi:hypothetical protein
MVDRFETERAAQREEFLEREQEIGKSPPKRFLPKKPGKAVKPKVLTFDQKLALTEQWLEATFPHLFAADDYIPCTFKTSRSVVSFCR